MRPAGFLALRRRGPVSEPGPGGQAAHHVLQLGTDDGVVVLALPAQHGGGIPNGGFGRRLAEPPWQGRLGVVRVQVGQRELKVGLGGGVDGRGGGQLSSAPSQDLLLGRWVGSVLLRSESLPETRLRSRLAPPGGGAGQTQAPCRRPSEHLWGGGERGLEEEGRVEAVVAAAWESAARAADGARLGVQDAELLVKLLRYLPRKLNQVAAVDFPISPVEPA